MIGGPHPRDKLVARHRSEEPPQARAPHAGWMTVQAGLLTCGSMLCFRLPGLESPVASWKRTHRLQLRAQLRIWRSLHRIPMLSISRPTNLNCPSLLKALLCLSTRPAAVYLETLQTGLVAKSKVISCQGTLGLLATRSVRVLRGTRAAMAMVKAPPPRNGGAAKSASS